MQNWKHKVIILAFTFAIASCANDNIAPLTILGKWVVVKDSLNFGGDGLNYMKSSADYYDFQLNGNLVVKEGGVIDNATYSISPENSINILYKENVWVKYIAINNGIVVKDSILNRFSKIFIISDLSLHSAKLSTSFYWKISPPPIINNESGDRIDSLRVNVLTVLSR